MDQPYEVLVRFHEIGLKGRNRPLFVRALADNVRRATAGTGVRRVWTSHMAVRLTLEPGSDWDRVRHALATVSGIAKFSRAYRAPAEYPAVEQVALALAHSGPIDSFRISSRRADKRFPLSSQELNVRLGDAVRRATGARVDLSHPQLDIRVEVLPEGAFVHAQDDPGPGGLPVGTGGRVVTLMSGGIDSPVAAWRMIHRGCRTVLVHFHSFPLVEGRSREKARELAEALTTYQLDTRLYLVPFAALQQRLILTVPGPLRVVLYRRFMLRIAERIAHQERAAMLVTGESLGQVGSQTLRNMATIGQAVATPVLRPLVGMDKQEIIAQAVRIGTYHTSILPDEDCCSLFVPRSPATHATLADVLPLEAEMDVPGLVTEAAAGSTRFDYQIGKHVTAARNGSPGR